jgi:hypothetical protein
MELFNLLVEGLITFKKLIGNKLVGVELSTFSKRKNVNYYIKFQVNEIGQMVSVGDELHVFMD